MTLNESVQAEEADEGFDLDWDSCCDLLTTLTNNPKIAGVYGEQTGLRDKRNCIFMGGGILGVLNARANT
jgi:hypothetical protein